MTELLHALERAMGAPRRRAASLVGGALVAAAAAGGLLFRSSRPDLCVCAEAEIAGAWGDANRAAVTAAFASSGNPHARDVAARVDKALTEYAKSWAAMRTESCQATRVRGLQSDEVARAHGDAGRARMLAERAAREYEEVGLPGHATVARGVAAGTTP